MTWVNIQPQDVLLFRDGKPFSSGEDHSASSIFPPTSLTVQGAMRAKISMSLGVSLEAYRNGLGSAQKSYEYIGAPSQNVETGLFTMQGPFVSLTVDGIVHQLLPAPADLFRFDPPSIPENLVDCIEASEKDEFQIATLMDSFLTDLEEDVQLLETIEDYENLGGYWMTADVFNDYLNGKSPPEGSYVSKEKLGQDDGSRQALNLSELYRSGFRLFPNAALYQTEGRFGVETNAFTSFREDGQLYQAQFIRMNADAGILINVANIPDENLLFGNLIIGGEQKQAMAQAVTKISSVKANPRSISGKFKLIVLTPAYFDGGWKSEAGFSEIFKAEVKLLGAALDRPQRIGGWSSNSNGARPMHNYVSAGSVYYFDAGNNDITLPSTFTQTPPEIADAGKIGFGQYSVAQWD